MLAKDPMVEQHLESMKLKREKPSMIKSGGSDKAYGQGYEDGKNLQSRGKQLERANLEEVPWDSTLDMEVEDRLSGGCMLD